MNLQRAVQQYLPLASWQTTAEIDAEIREELAFHLHMRTQDNLRAGMSPEKARSDAQQRFGSFEANRHACRKITLGPRLMLRRLQTGLLIVLIGTVIYQGALQIQLQTSSKDQIETLTQLVEQLRAGRETVENQAATIPYAHWKIDLHRDITDDKANAKAVVVWSTTDDPLQQPWSDWAALGKQKE
jgi:hypothetical protein